MVNTHRRLRIIPRPSGALTAGEHHGATRHKSESLGVDLPEDWAPDLRCTLDLAVTAIIFTTTNSRLTAVCPGA